MTYASEVLADSPLLYWRLGESSGTVASDASGNGRTGTYSGGPTLGVTGLLVADSNTAVDFDGTNDYVTYSDTTDLTAFTVEAWIQTTVNNRYIATRYGTAGNRIFQLYLETGTGKPVATVTNSAGTNGTATPTAAMNLSDGAVHQVALVYDPTVTNRVIIYVDGSKVADAAHTGTLTTNDVPFVVGANASGAVLFDGVIDEVSYYGTALSAARIAAHYSAGSTPPAPITIHPAKITSTGTVHAPAIVPYIPPPVDGNITITAELTPATKYAACIEPDRSAQIEPARHVAGVNAT